MEIKILYTNSGIDDKTDRKPRFLRWKCQNNSSKSRFLLGNFLQFLFFGGFFHRLHILFSFFIRYCNNRGSNKAKNTKPAFKNIAVMFVYEFKGPPFRARLMFVEYTQARLAHALQFSQLLWTIAFQKNFLLNWSLEVRSISDN